ncbi:unnamed protein product [marine sediment metagenome]|uniref:N-acetyltransferase domain-containing protein n=1 Tax=marine sediment metagenome TaxID=412755 RepID=X0U9P7_9ZZZZ
MMVDVDNIQVLVNPKITPEQLFSFYERNNICEAELGKDVVFRVLSHSTLVIGAFEDAKLVGITRVMFDGLSAAIMEFSLELEYQGKHLKYSNGSLIEKDLSGLGEKIAKVLFDELAKLGATFVSDYIVENCEEAFYRSIGFVHNKSHLVYIVDKRPYI